ncbi:MAG: hypothetical protein U9M89_02070 [Patescibacteria group bacterium]|nr:hypothetical protein [Patescibacteria group bacterium]
MCGTVSIVNLNPSNPVPNLVETGCDILLNLRNRGDEAWGIGVDGEGSSPNVRWKLGEPVTRTLTPKTIQRLVRQDLIGVHNIMIAQLRYATTSERTTANAQPHHFGTGGQRFVLASNGDLPFCEEERQKLEAKKYAFESHCDADVIVKYLGNAWIENGRNELEAFKQTGNNLSGAFSLVCITPSKRLFLMRDRHGFRPLWFVVNNEKNLFYSCSENGILEDLFPKANPIEVKPEEIIVVDPKTGSIHKHQFADPDPKYCLMEYFYFQRPDSKATQKAKNTMHGYRFRLGMELADQWVEEGYPIPNVVCCVPYSGAPAAQGFAYKLEIPYIDIVFKDRWAGRVFMADGKTREQLLREKLQIIRDFFQEESPIFMGKNIVVIDDSIVRGDQSKIISGLLRNAGAGWVGYGSTAPPYRYPCFYGINTPDSQLLIAHGKTIEEVRSLIGVDYLHYLSLSGAYHVIDGNEDNLCNGCFTCNYPTPVPEHNCKAEV